MTQNLIFGIITCLLPSCRPDDSDLINDPKFSGGREYGTDKPIAAKVYKFGDYSIITGSRSDSAISSLGIFFKNREIYYENSSDGVYDTIFDLNLNNDEIPDFAVSYKFEDGASLNGLLSGPNRQYFKKRIFSEWTEVHCLENIDTLKGILPLQVRDIDGDGITDFVSNSVSLNGHTFAISCTDTVFSRDIK
jgi:hypothetical protein